MASLQLSGNLQGRVRGNDKQQGLKGLGDHNTPISGSGTKSFATEYTEPISLWYFKDHQQALHTKQCVYTSDKNTQGGREVGR